VQHQEYDEEAASKAALAAATDELKDLMGEFGDFYFEDIAKVVFTQNNRQKRCAF
jgi:hypothetical protein